MKRWVYFDCDDTLVMWPPHKGRDEDLIHIPDPYQAGKTIAVYPHKEHIAYLKNRWQKNDDTIVVWSAGGQPWAQAVVTALGLGNVVDHILAKPDVYVDDLHCAQFMGQQLYKPYGDEQSELFGTSEGLATTTEEE